MGQNDRNNGPRAHKVINGMRKSKWTKGAQRKELVNGVGSKASKPKGKVVVIGLGKPKGFSKNP